MVLTEPSQMIESSVNQSRGSVSKNQNLSFGGEHSIFASTEDSIMGAETMILPMSSVAKSRRQTNNQTSSSNTQNWNKRKNTITI